MDEVTDEVTEEKITGITRTTGDEDKKDKKDNNRTE
mgnify:CR=1 FL=1